jgi:O-succinylbenzoate synthase
MKIDSITLREIHMRLKAPFEASFGTTQNRRILLVELIADGVTGWGEVTTFEAPSYNAETTETAWHIISDFIVPNLIGKNLSTASEFPALMSRIRGNEMAKGAVENAIWHSESLRKEISCGVSLGIRENPQALVEKVQEELRDGYQRIKLKIKPEKDLDFVAAVRRQFPDILLSVDANSAYSLDDVAHLQRLDEYRLLMMEQPLSWDDLYGHSKLQAQIQTAICLDECIYNTRHALAAIELKACRIVNIKLGRVGGHTEARSIQEACRERDVPVWCGGMLESGIGRAHNIAMSTLPGFSLPGDVSASQRYWNEDIIDPPVTVTSRGTIPIADTPGFGYEVKKGLIEKMTVRQKNWRTQSVAS